MYLKQNCARLHEEGPLSGNEEDLLRRIQALLAQGSLRLEEHHGLGHVAFFQRPDRHVADDTTKFIAYTGQGEPAVVVLWSALASPGLVARGMEIAEAARKLSGSYLAGAIIKPLLTGALDGRTYAVLPYCRPLSRHPLGWSVQKVWLRERLLRWLREMTRVTAKQATGEEVERDFRIPLSYVAEHRGLGTAVRNAAQRALCRLDSGQWSPRYVFAHNDLWKDNILSHRGILAPESAREWGFVLIDWAGGRERGHGIYDLVRLGLSLKLPQGRFLRELLEHCKLLSCSRDDCEGHFLSSAGYLGMHLEQFAEDRYIRSVETCYFKLSEILC
jgi:hypothetical protein